VADKRGRSNRAAIYSRFAAYEITVDERDTAKVGASDESGEVRVPVDRVVDQLARIGASRAFANAPMLRRFVEHVVTAAMAGRSHELKEYSIGVEVFGRGPAFDPRVDTIVRVEARRLRSKLQEYYAGEGRADPVVFELPKGHYVPEFRLAGPPRQRPWRAVIEDVPQPHPSGAGSLPVPAMPLLGRERELAAVTELLSLPEVRLVTLTGPGGSGKTRLGLEVAARVSNDFPGGVCFIGLASAVDADSVTRSIAEHFDVRHTGGRPLLDVLVESLKLSLRKRTLLFLDNFEHVMDASLTLTRMLESSALLQILVTSRAVLHLSGEHEYPVPPLPLPDAEDTSLEAVSRSPSVQLFVQRAAAVVPDFELTVDHAVPVAQICARVDGLPLAIELAAARIKMFSPAAIRVRLEQGLDFLSRGPSDVPVRQQTLRKTIDWSYELLGPAEQALFQRLSVFRGGWTLEAVEAVCNTRRDLGSDVVDALSSLLDKSLVTQVDTGDEGRFSMLETLREYALERLVESGDLAPTRKAHAAYCLVLAEEGNALLTDLNREEWLASCDTEHDNMRAALDWLVEQNGADWGLRLAGALFAFWERREHLVEGRARCEALLKLPGASGRTRSRANIVRFAAAFATTMGDFANADAWNDEAFEIYRELGDRKGIVAQLNTRGVQAGLAGNWLAARRAFEESLAGCRELGDLRATASILSNLADVVSAQGDLALARTLLEEAQEKFCQVEDWRGVGWSLNHLGDVARESGDLAGARRLYEEGAKLFRDRGDPWGTARSLADLGDLAREQNELAAASGLLKDALAIFTGLRHRRGIATVLDRFAGLAARAGDVQRALTLAGAAAALRQMLGAPRRPRDRGRVDETVDELRRRQDGPSMRAYWTAGATMALEDAIRYALDERMSPPPAAPGEKDA